MIRLVRLCQAKLSIAVRQTAYAGLMATSANPSRYFGSLDVIRLVHDVREVPALTSERGRLLAVRGVDLCLVTVRPWWNGFVRSSPRRSGGSGCSGYGPSHTGIGISTRST